MTILGEAAALKPQVLLRSLWHRDPRLVIPDETRRRQQRHALSALRLVSHLAMTSLLFLALITLVWIVSWTFHFMHSLYPFPEAAFQLLDGAKIVLVYLDVTVSGIVMLNGIWHYVAEVIRGDA